MSQVGSDCVGSTETTAWSPPDRLLLVVLSSSSRTVLVGWFESRLQGVRKLSLAPHTLAHTFHMPAHNLTCTSAGGYPLALS